jgi:hypothetical protein
MTLTGPIDLLQGRWRRAQRGALPMDVVVHNDDARGARDNGATSDGDRAFVIGCGAHAERHSQWHTLRARRRCRPRRLQCPVHSMAAHAERAPLTMAPVRAPHSSNRCRWSC